MGENHFTEHFFEAFMTLMVETFECGRAGYLDRGTSIFETLATISAEEASRPISSTCATVAAHVAHITVALNFSVHLFRGEHLHVNWGEIWATDGAVTKDEWHTRQESLRENYYAFCELAKQHAGKMSMSLRARWRLPRIMPII